MTRFSRRTDWFLEPNDISLALSARKKSGQEVFDLTESNPTHCGLVCPDPVLAALNTPDNARYEPSPRGLLAARQAVSADYARRGMTVDPQRIFLVSSTSEAYSFLFRLLADPYDTVLLPAPSYPLFQFLVDVNDLQTRNYALRYEESSGWRVNMKSLDEALQDGARALVMVNPNNPTGSFIRPEELSAINALCRREDVPVVCDEVFGDYHFRGTGGLSLVNNDEVLTFVLSGVSKTLALPQMKLSWIVVNGPADEVKEAMDRLEVIADTYLSVNTPVQNAFPSWLAYRADIQQQVLTRVRANYDFLSHAFSSPETGHCLQAEAGWYAVIRLPNKTKEEKLILNLVHEDGVYVHPGYFFDFSDGAHLVISLLPPERIIVEGAQRIIRRLARRD